MKTHVTFTSRSTWQTADADRIGSKTVVKQRFGQSFQDNRPGHIDQTQLCWSMKASTPKESSFPIKNTPSPLPIQYPAIQRSPIRTLVTQRKTPFDMSETTVKEMVDVQKKEQQTEYFIKNIPFTTVGFEYEFAQFDFSDDPQNPLKDVTHLELIRSAETMLFSKLPFSLETDAADAIELVTPPFLIQTVGNRPIPNPTIVQHVNDQMKTELLQIAGNKTDVDIPSGQKLSVAPPQGSRGGKKKVPVVASEPPARFPQLLGNVIAMTGFRFPPLADIRVRSANINPGTLTGGPILTSSPLPDAEAGAATPTSSATPSSTPYLPPSGSADTAEPVRIIDSRILAGLKIKPSSKAGGGRHISEQINIATDAYAYDDLKKNGGPPGLTDREFLNLENILKSLMQDVLNDSSSTVSPATALKTAVPKKRPVPTMCTPKETPFEDMSPRMQIFLNELARNLSQCVAIPAIEAVKTAKQTLFQALPCYTGATSKKFVPKSPLSAKEVEALVLKADFRSHVKDVNDVWLKDTLVSFAIGLFRQPEEYDLVIQLLANVQKNLLKFKLPVFQTPSFKNIFSASKPINELLIDYLDLLIPLFQTQHDRLDQQLRSLTSPIRSPEIQSELWAQPYPFPTQSVPFGEHNPLLPGVRHDTFIHPTYVNRIPYFSSRWLHVVEIRDNPIERIHRLAMEEDERMSKLKEIQSQKLKGELLQKKMLTLIQSGKYTIEDISVVWEKSPEFINHFLSQSFTPTTGMPVIPASTILLPGKIEAKEPSVPLSSLPPQKEEQKQPQKDDAEDG